jgi:hypothetical protein
MKNRSVQQKKNLIKRAKELLESQQKNSERITPVLIPTSMMENMIWYLEDSIPAIKFGRQFMDLTEEEIRQVVDDMFHPVIKITCFKKRSDYISVKVYVDGETLNENHEIVPAPPLVVKLRDPWRYGYDAVDCGDDNAYDTEVNKLLKFCFAKGICFFGENNPYIPDGIQTWRLVP